MTIPNGLPTLSHGAHTPHEGKACFMEYASLLAGEAWSDSPACTHPVIAQMARSVNDRLPDSERHRLAPLIPSVIGTADTREDATARRVLSVRLAVWCARQVLDLAPDRSLALAAIEAAEAWADSPTGANAHAAYAAHANAVAYAAAAAHAAAAHAAAEPVGLLTGLIAEHARLTGHTVSDDIRETWEAADFNALLTGRAS